MDTTIWTEITMTGPTEDDYRNYDMIVSMTLKHIVDCGVGLGKIRLMNFCRKDKEHLFMLRMALMAGDLYHLPVEVECNWLDRLILNWKIRKSFEKIKKPPYFACTGVWVPIMLDAIRKEANEKLGIFADFGEIYDAYYEGSLD